MTRRETTTEISKTEISVLEAEKRTEAAKVEFEQICDDKKRVLGEIDKAQKDLADAKAILDKANSEIKQTNDNLEIVKDSYIKENNSFDKITENRKLAEKDLETFKKASALEFTKINSEILALKEQQTGEKNKALAELREVEGQKNSILDIIATKTDSLELLKKQEEILVKKIDELDVSHKNILDKKSATEDDLAKVSDDIANKNTALETVKSEIKNIEVLILGKQNELKDIEQKTVAKNDEYKQSESKLFALLKREDTLKQKELFIKNQYERAGVKWEE